MEAEYLQLGKKQGMKVHDLFKDGISLIQADLGLAQKRCILCHAFQEGTCLCTRTE